MIMKRICLSSTSSSRSWKIKISWETLWLINIKYSSVTREEMTSSPSPLRREPRTLLCLEIDTAPEAEPVRLSQQWGFGFIYQMSPPFHVRGLRRLQAMTSSLKLLSPSWAYFAFASPSALSLPICPFILCVWPHPSRLFQQYTSRH